MLAGLMELSEEGPEVAKVCDWVVSGPHGQFPVRVFTPRGAGPFPVYVYFHGGGWVMGNIAMTESECRHVARDAGCVVVSIDYHLAPEHKFPIPLEDCYAATTWVVEHAAELAVDLVGRGPEVFFAWGRHTAHRVGGDKRRDQDPRARPHYQPVTLSSFG